MKFDFNRALQSLMLTVFAATAAAQTPAAIPAAVTKSASPTTLQYRSAIGAYQAYVDQPVQAWREANDLVGSNGGWRAYVKERAVKEPADNATATNKYPSDSGGGRW